METVNKKFIKQWIARKKSIYIERYWRSGISNHCFGMLSGMKFKCDDGHLNRFFHTQPFFNLETPHEGASFEEMIKFAFKEKPAFGYCKKCKEKVKGRSRRRLMSLPQSLMIVLDRFNKNGALQNLVSCFPKELDLHEHFNKLNQTKKVSRHRYELSGLIAQDQIHLDYKTDTI